MTLSSLWMGLVARVPCVVCAQLGYETPAQVHHMRDGNLGKRQSDFLTIAVCPEHHTGSYSIHKDRERFERQFGSELQLLALTIEGVARVLMRMGVK